jgi:alpha-glucosidase
VLEENLFRVLIKRKGELALDRTWSIAPSKMCRGKAVAATI